MTSDEKKLSLSFDATAVPSEPVGAGRYTIDLARALRAIGGVDLSIWCRTGDAARIRTAIEGPRTAIGDSLHEIEESPRLMPVSPRGRMPRLIWEQLRMPGLVDGLQADVHHSPHYTMPERSRTPVVVTIHDLTFFDHPEWHERSKVLVFRRAIRRAASKAAVLVCVSQSTAERLGEHTRPRGQVVVVGHGVDERLFHPPDPGDTDLDSATLEKAGVRSPYVLFVGTLEPRKAVPNLVKAFDGVAAGNRDLSLVLAGGRGWGADEVDRTIAASAHRDRVISTGYVSDGLVAVLMRRAAVVVYPAFEEGFGLPALEALASGTPLVTTKGSAMAEVAGVAASLVAPGDTEALAEAIEDAVSGGSEVARRVAAGAVVAASHTWEASARGHLEAYRLAMETGRP